MDKNKNSEQAAVATDSGSGSNNNRGTYFLLMGMSEMEFQSTRKILVRMFLPDFDEMSPWPLGPGRLAGERCTYVYLGLSFPYFYKCSLLFISIFL